LEAGTETKKSQLVYHVNCDDAAALSHLERIDLLWILLRTGNPAEYHDVAERWPVDTTVEALFNDSPLLVHVSKGQGSRD
jgi:hypothetical protein